MYKLALAFVSMIFLVATPAAAAGSPSDNWVVTQLSGDARVLHPGAQAASLKINNRLAPGDTLLTGPTGRATLIHGDDYIIVAPHSEMRIPSTPQASGFTRVIQNLGTLLFKVQHTGIPHFAVDTPMLAAVVKGTTFTVVVDQHRSAVQVIQGVVQVNAIDGGMMRMVEGGRTVFVNHDQPKILLDADKALPATSSPTSTSVAVSAAGESPLAAIATLTGGLLRADLSSPQPTNQATAPTTQDVVAASGSPAPAASTPGASTTITTSLGSTPTVIVATNTTTVSAPSATVTAPSTSTPVVSAPPATIPITTVPSVTIGSVTTPAVTVPPVTTPTVTVPSVTIGSVTTPAVTVPPVTTPTVTVPSVTIGSVTTPTVTVPPVTTPAVTVPAITIGSNSGPGSMNSGSGSMNSGPGSMNSGSSRAGLLSGLVTTVGNTVGSINGGLSHH
jgi:collagen type III alpha